LLVLDEARVLADPTHADLAHALRAALDSRKVDYAEYRLEDEAFAGWVLLQGS